MAGARSLRFRGTRPADGPSRVICRPASGALPPPEGRGTHHCATERAPRQGKLGEGRVVDVGPMRVPQPMRPSPPASPSRMGVEARGMPDRGPGRRVGSRREPGRGGRARDWRRALR
jgi:hypothetical protein